MNKGAVFAGVALAVVGLVVLSKKASADTGASCFNAKANQYYYVTWPGSDKSLADIFGASTWAAIFTVDYFETETQNWTPFPDPNHTVLHAGDHIRFMLANDETVCGFAQD
ncbi:MAG: hypothetical protein ACYDHZ_00745 [Dehalococcoidia bacterium]